MNRNQTFGLTCLIDELDNKVFAILNDGKHVVGKLTSFDRFGNIVLENASERYYSKTKMTEVEMGCMICECFYVFVTKILVNLGQFYSTIRNSGNGGYHRRGKGSKWEFTKCFLRNLSGRCGE